jgi:hypothetical protein
VCERFHLARTKHATTTVATSAVTAHATATTVLRCTDVLPTSERRLDDRISVHVPLLMRSKPGAQSWHVSPTKPAVHAQLPLEEQRPTPEHSDEDPMMEHAAA